MSSADVFDIHGRDRITDVRSYSLSGWMNPRPPLTPEQVEAQARNFREQQREIMLWRIRHKERNMLNRLERRRAAIRGRWIERGKAAITVLALMLVIPLAGACIAAAWNMLWRVTL